MTPTQRALAAVEALTGYDTRNAQPLHDLRSAIRELSRDLVEERADHETTWRALENVGTNNARLTEVSMGRARLLERIEEAANKPETTDGDRLQLVRSVLTETRLQALTQAGIKDPAR